MLDSLFLLAAASTEAAGNGVISDLAGKFGVEWTTVVAQAINFVVVGFLLWKFAYKPVIATLEERQQKIAEGLQFAEKAKVDLAEAEKRQAELLREANASAQQILHAARESAKAFEDKMKGETAAQIEDMRRRADEANELERQKMLSEVRSEIARLVVLTSGKVLQRELQSPERDRLNAAAIEEIARLN